MAPSQASSSTLVPPELEGVTDKTSIAPLVSHGVHFWPDGAMALRRVLSVLGDSNHVRFQVGGDVSLCIHSARSGWRVRNAIVRKIPTDGERWLVFEPEDGPGEYELYNGCVDKAQPAEAHWRAALPRKTSAIPRAILARRETYGAVVGPRWHEPDQGGGYGAQRQSYGNIRARMLVASDVMGGAVRAFIPWRRRRWPADTQLYLFHSDSLHTEHVQNMIVLSDSREIAEIVFEPADGPGEYVLYYLPHITRWETYDARDDSHGTSYSARFPEYSRLWWARHANRSSIPIARMLDIQARSHADRFDAMERPATMVEVEAHLRAAANVQVARSPTATARTPRTRASSAADDGDDDGTDGALQLPLWLLFPESRMWPLKLDCELPERWAKRRPTRALTGHARLGEFYVWQVGVYAPSKLDVRVIDCKLLVSRWARQGAELPPTSSNQSLHCFNLGGIGHAGQQIRMQPVVRSGCAQSLWFGLQLPTNLPMPLEEAGASDEAVREDSRDFDDGSNGGDDDKKSAPRSPTFLVKVALTFQSVPAENARGVNPPMETDVTTLKLAVHGPALSDSGDASDWRLSRLRWLHSMAGAHPKVPHPFTPVTVHESEWTPSSLKEARAYDATSLHHAWRFVGHAMERLSSVMYSQATTSRRPAFEVRSLMARAIIGGNGLPLQLQTHGRMPNGRLADVQDATSESRAHPSGAGSSALSCMQCEIGALGAAHPSCVHCKSAGSGHVEGHRAARVDASELYTLLDAPIDFRVTRLDDSAAREQLEGSEVHWRVTSAAEIPAFPETDTAAHTHGEAVRWRAELESDDGELQMTVNGEWWFDAQLIFAVKLTATRRVELTQAKLVLNVKDIVGKYLMGFGKSGNTLQANTPLEWHWQEGLGNYMGWVGDVHAGVRVRLTGEAAGFESPQHLLTRADLPESWHNDGAGGVQIDRHARLSAYSGRRVLERGQSVLFRWELLLTPCKPLDTSSHWSERYYQVGYPDTHLIPPEDVASQGATILNIHQGVDGDVNPYINYPFDRATSRALASYISRAHAKQLRVKAYYTVRELSNHAKELWVLRSLGSEILTGGRGGGDPWVNEHLIGDYAACWQNPLSSGEFDSALCNQGISRWVNFYVEGLQSLLRPPVNLDGIYYDGIAFGVHTMRRVRRVLQATKGIGRGLIDMHCGNNFLGTQYGQVSPALQFMHLMPYIDSLWFGEGYDYNDVPAYWLVEVSGIPFGLMGDMMREGHTWRGMLYGMTSRFRSADPSPLWKLFDTFGIHDAIMYGYWDPATPVAVDGIACSNVLATSYVRHRKQTLIAIASWDVDEVVCELSVDWSALELKEAEVQASLVYPILLPDLHSSELPTESIPRNAGNRFSLRIGANEGALVVLHTESIGLE